MRNTGAITEDKIGDLGRAMASRSSLLLEVYLSQEAVPYTDKKSKSLQCLRDYGVITESKEGMSLSREARMIFDKIAKKTYRMHIMPDIENWKRDVALHSERALNAALDGDDIGSEDAHIDEVVNLVRDLSDALNQEMASIEYSIYSELNDTTNLKDKRVVLYYLMEKIKAQISKIQSLSYEDLRQCASNNQKVHMIMARTLNIVVSNCLDELSVNLTKVSELIEKLNKERKRQDEMVRRLQKGLRNGMYVPSDMSFSFSDLDEAGLCVGGLAFDELTNIDLEDKENDYFLLTVLDKVTDNEKLKELKAKSAKVYTGTVVEVEEQPEERELSPSEKEGYAFLAYNSENEWSENLSAYEYWEHYNLKEMLEYKSFLAIVLHQCNSDFRNDIVVNKRDGYEWKLYVKTIKPFPLCDTVYVQDARYYCYEASGEEPDKDLMWTRN